MSTSATSATSAGPGRSPSSAARAGSWPNPGLRIGDAERAEVTDRLAKHYSDGRLDQAEFEDRLDKAMRATTAADLAGLLADLPDGQPLSFLYRMPSPELGPELGAGPGGRRHRRRLLKLQLEHQRLLVRQERHELRRQQRAGHGHALAWIMAIVALLIVGSLAMRALAQWFVVCLLLALIALLLMRRGSGGSGSSGGRADR